MLSIFLGLLARPLSSQARGSEILPLDDPKERPLPPCWSDLLPSPKSLTFEDSFLTSCCRGLWLPSSLFLMARAWLFLYQYLSHDTRHWLTGLSSLPPIHQLRWCMPSLSWYVTWMRASHLRLFPLLDSCPYVGFLLGISSFLTVITSREPTSAFNLYEEESIPVICLLCILKYFCMPTSDYGKFVQIKNWDIANIFTCAYRWGV